MNYALSEAAFDQADDKKNVYDMIIVGGGVMGASAAVSAARRGLKCLLLEQYSCANDRASSHGMMMIMTLIYLHVSVINVVLSHLN